MSIFVNQVLLAYSTSSFWLVVSLLWLAFFILFIALDGFTLARRFGMRSVNKSLIALLVPTGAACNVQVQLMGKTVGDIFKTLNFKIRRLNSYPLISIICGIVWIYICLLVGFLVFSVGVVCYHDYWVTHIDPVSTVFAQVQPPFATYGCKFVEYDVSILLAQLCISFFMLVIFRLIEDQVVFDVGASTNRYHLLNDSLVFFLAAFWVMVMLVAVRSLILVYLLITALSVLTYVLIAFDRSYTSIEAALKYFCLSALASGFMGFGYLLIFQQYFFALSSLSPVTSFDPSIDFFLHIGYMFFIFGLFFKLTLVPFYIWVPDVYEGSSLIVVLFMAVAVKFSVFCVLVKFYLYHNFFCFISLNGSLAQLFLGVGLLSIFVGSIGAVSQYKLKRFFAFTSIGQFGFMLVGLTADAYALSSLFMLVVYCISTLVIFGVFASLRGVGPYRPITYISDLHNFFMVDSSAIFLVLFSILSIAGVPPFVGFFSKYFILLSVFSNYYILGLVLFLLHVVSTFNYLRLIRNLCVWNPELGVRYYVCCNKSLTRYFKFFTFWHISPLFLGLDLIVRIFS